MEAFAGAKHPDCGLGGHVALMRQPLLQASPSLALPSSHSSPAVVTPFLQQGITVALPKNMNNPDVDPNIIKESSIVISVPNDGEYYLGKERVAKEASGVATAGGCTT